MMSCCAESTPLSATLVGCTSSDLISLGLGSGACSMTAGFRSFLGGGSAAAGWCAAKASAAPVRSVNPYRNMRCMLVPLGYGCGWFRALSLAARRQFKLDLVLNWSRTATDGGHSFAGVAYRKPRR